VENHQDDCGDGGVPMPLRHSVEAAERALDRREQCGQHKRARKQKHRLDAEEFRQIAPRWLAAGSSESP
jgi:hypothetical protein